MNAFKTLLPIGYREHDGKIYRERVERTVIEDQDGKQTPAVDTVNLDLVCPFAAFVGDVHHLPHGGVFELATQRPTNHDEWQTKYYDVKELCEGNSALLRELTGAGSLPAMEKMRLFLLDSITAIESIKPKAIA
jgi:hypothetical protein